MAASTEQPLRSLHHGIQRCRKCDLADQRTHAVPGEGPHSADLMLVGEAPGEAEDHSGRPFVGRAGRFLDEILSEAGFSRRRLYITSAVKCRPPDNRPPTDSELQTCRRAWLDRQLELVCPQWVVSLGLTPGELLLGESIRLRQTHGTVHTCGQWRVFLTYHPAAGMRFPDVAGAMREDFARLRRLTETNHQRRQHG